MNEQMKKSKLANNAYFDSEFPFGMLNFDLI